MIVVEGEGAGFCAGYDLQEYAQAEPGVSRPGSQTGSWDPYLDYHLMKRNTDDFMSLWYSLKPTYVGACALASPAAADAAMQRVQGTRLRRRGRLRHCAVLRHWYAAAAAAAALSVRWAHESKPRLLRASGDGGDGQDRLPAGASVGFAVDADVGVPRRRRARQAYAELRCSQGARPLTLTHLPARTVSSGMLLTGDLITGREAAAIGLVSQAVPREELVGTVARLVQRMASVPKNQLMMNKLVVNQAYENMVRASEHMSEQRHHSEH